jgi:DNA-binding GntR family transcriptional regulator
LPSNSERIYHALEAVVSIAIAFGHYRIDENAAASAFGASCSAVRKALSGCAISASWKNQRIHHDPATLVEHRAVLRPLLDGDIDAAANALLEHLRAVQKRTLQRLKVLAVLPDPDLPGYAADRLRPGQVG